MREVSHINVRLATQKCAKTARFCGLPSAKPHHFLPPLCQKRDFCGFSAKACYWYIYDQRFKRNMLIAFRFRNFMSFKGEAELSLISHNSDKTLSSSLILAKVSPRKDIKLLPAVAIYGANSAGKTNVLHAINFMKRAVVDSQNKWKPDGGTSLRPFGPHNDTKSVASFEADFIINDVRYTYGFSASVAAFKDEWLISHAGGRKRELFSRKVELEEELYRDEKRLSARQEVTVKFGTKLFSPDDEYASSILKKVRGNSLFLSAAAQDNHPECRDIYKWFDNLSLENISGFNDRNNAMTTAELIVNDETAKSRVIKILKAADPCLHDIEVIRTNISIDNPALESLTDQEKERFARDFRFNIFFVVKDGNDTVRLPFDRQSKGFQKLFSIAHYIISSLNSGQILLIDEIETSIHPHLARFIVDLFQNSEINIGRSQVIFTTHDTTMLDQSLLRRDQIWFVEKKGVCSDLYSLLEFSPRKDESLERGYLRGRYGAIPALGLDLDWTDTSRSQSHQEPSSDAR